MGAVILSPCAERGREGDASREERHPKPVCSHVFLLGKAKVPWVPRCHGLALRGERPRKADRFLQAQKVQDSGELSWDGRDGHLPPHKLEESGSFGRSDRIITMRRKGG